MSNTKKVMLKCNNGKPIIISGFKKRNVVFAPHGMTASSILSNLKVATGPIYREETIYESTNCDFLKGEPQQVLIVNKVNIATKASRTIAKCTSKGVCVETTSDDVCAVIGQKNYETLLSSLGSLFNLETKVRGILALLKPQTKYRTVATQTPSSNIKTERIDSSCQTLELDIEVAGKQKHRKRIRRQPFAPYVVKEEKEVKEVKKCVINIDNICKKEEFKKEPCDDKKAEITEELYDLKGIVNEDSNFSCGSIGNMSLSSVLMPDFLNQPHLEAATINSITKVTSPSIKVFDGKKIMVPVVPKDEFHITTPEILRNVTHEERMKLLCHQAFIDFKMCLQQNEDGYYPLHIAVLHSDHELVRRLCLAMRARHESIDKLAGGMTALHMSIRNNSSVECTRELLQRGADPLLQDSGGRCALHLAALAPAHLTAVLAHCDSQPRQVLVNNQDYWKPELEGLLDKELAKYLYEKTSEIFDEQGDTPLMVAAGAGRAAATAALAARAPARVDAASRACGATALYRAVAAACLHAKDNGNTVVPEHLLQTAEILVRHGADPTIENQSGSSVNTLLQEYNLPPLSMVIANQMCSMKHGKLATSMILVKDRDGRIVPETMHKRKTLEMLPKIKSVMERPTELSNKIVELKRKLENPNDPRAKEAKLLKTATVVRNDTILLNNRNDSKCAKVIPNVTCSNDAEPGTSKSKVVIVGNISVKTDFAKVNISPGSSVDGKPQEISLLAPKTDHQVQLSQKLQKPPKYVKIAPKPLRFLNCIQTPDKNLAPKTKSDSEEKNNLVLLGDKSRSMD